MLKQKGADARYMPLIGQNHGSTLLAAMADGISVAFGKGGTP